MGANMYNHEKKINFLKISMKPFFADIEKDFNINSRAA